MVEPRHRPPRSCRFSPSTTAHSSGGGSRGAGDPGRADPEAAAGRTRPPRCCHSCKMRRSSGCSSAGGGSGGDGCGESGGGVRSGAAGRRDTRRRAAAAGLRWRDICNDRRGSGEGQRGWSAPLGSCVPAALMAAAQLDASTPALVTYYPWQQQQKQQDWSVNNAVQVVVSIYWFSYSDPFCNSGTNVSIVCIQK